MRLKPAERLQALRLPWRPRDAAEVGRVAIEFALRDHVATISFRAPFVLGQTERETTEAA